MEIIRKRAYARAGLLGNPSDGYGGRTISHILRNFWAEVVLYEWDTVEIVLARNDRASFRSIHDLARDVQLHGYYGGIRLIKATIKRFVDYCADQEIELHSKTFSIRYDTNIPMQVGLAGSSAIIVATLRALSEFYAIEIPIEAQPSLVLSVESDELGIAAGLQDRVIQCYEGVVYMDFHRSQQEEVAGLPTFRYERLPRDWSPPLYVAYHAALSEPTERFHNDIRGRFFRGEPLIVSAMEKLADLTAEGRAAWLDKDATRLHELIDRNFAIRQSIYALPHWQVEMVETARRFGASAKFAGSGGAIVGLYQDPADLEPMGKALSELGCRLIDPVI